MNTKEIVYCSGPLFCPEEIYGMDQIARVCEQAGYKTFVPHRDGLERWVMGMANDPRLTNKAFRRINNYVHKAIFSLDMYQILERCDYLVFNMNGRVPDEGGVVETAVAFAAGKPLILYKDDHRTKFNGYDNSMITGLSYTFSKVNQLKEIPAELVRVKRLLDKEGQTPYSGGNVPPMMRRVVTLGRRVWKLMGPLRLAEASDEQKTAILEKIADLADQAGGEPGLYLA